MCGGSSMVEQQTFPFVDGGSIPTSPLQFSIVEIEKKAAVNLNFMWHSRLPEIKNWQSLTVCFGAVFNRRIYAVALLGPPVARAFNNSGTIELRRMAVSKDAPKNTCSRMLRIVILLIKKTMPHINRVISYQDSDVHTGVIYKAAGWAIGRITKPEEVRWGKGGRKRNAIVAPGMKIRWEKKWAKKEVK
jgi:hypothetical protein